METLLILAGFFGGIIFVVKLLIDIIKRNSKKVDLIGIAICFALLMMGVNIDGGKSTSDGIRSELGIETGGYAEMKENIVGVSDKDIKKVTKTKPSKVLNDSTGKWKKLIIAESVDITEYAKSYSDRYMKDGDVHFVVNFNYNTTTRINKQDDMIHLTIMEYVKKEEHDAKTIGSGMVLKKYIIYPDGDIEEVK